MKHNPVYFNNYENPVDFDRARIQLDTPFQYVDFDLSLAGINQIINISGDFLYCDPAYDGYLTLELNNQQDAPSAPFYVQKNFALHANFKQIKVSWPAQPGKKVRLMYSTGESVIPSNSGVLQVTGTISTIEDGFTYGASFKSSGALGANTAETVFSPSANINGAIIQFASFTINEAAAQYPIFTAKTSAPINSQDGDIILQSTSNINAIGASYGCVGSLSKTVKIQAGKGLYFISGGAITNSLRSVLYTLL